MEILKKSIILVFVCLSLNSCQDKKPTVNHESEFYIDSIYSEFLKEYRNHTIYLPSQYSSKNEYPIIYATDGSKNIENSRIKQILDSLIDNKIIKPILYIGSHSNSKIADSTSTRTGNGQKVYLNYRNFEYVKRKTFNDTVLASRFLNHMSYFKDELIPKTEHLLNQKLNRQDRYFYGVSNGAGFGMHLLNAYPDLIGTYLCFSTFGGDIQGNNWKNNTNYPNLYLRYGSEEPFFLEEDVVFMRDTYAKLNLKFEAKMFDGGHDNRQWNKEFAALLSKLFKIE